MIWHIFKKDARRLWWEAAITLGLLAWFAHLDRWRADYTPGFAEGWLNVLLPFAWAVLAGVLVLQDPLVGDREFWVTLPCRWRSMLGAKALFLLAFIHLPYFLAQFAILAARGFQPFAFLPHLLWKQAALFLVVTLPAAALAALVRNVVQYLLAALLMAAAVVFLAGNVDIMAMPWAPWDAARLWIALLVVVVGALAVALAQYRRRSTAVARGVGIAAAALAAALYAWLPRESTAAVKCAFLPAPATGPFSVELSPQQEPLPPGLAFSRSPGAPVTIALPLEISRWTPDAPLRIDQLALEIQAGGQRYKTSARFSRVDPNAALYGYLWRSDRRPYEILAVRQTVYDGAKDKPVTVKGAIVAEYRRLGTAVRIPMSARADAPGLGKCYSALVEGRGLWQGSMFKVNCESPDPIPYPTTVLLQDQKAGRVWRHSLGDATTVVGYPRNTWLSPLNHRTTFFQLTTEENYQKHQSGSQWLVPEEALSAATLEAVPEPSTGCKVVKYEFRNVSLPKFALPPAK